MKTTAKIIQIGNSRGIRLPKKALDETGLSGEVELITVHNELVIRPLQHTRVGREESYVQMAKNGEDSLLIGEQPASEWDKSEWQW
ncbi:AbrB/MazE/SpoVT family DNA-binding domain-containing protein [Candidatus Saccharibacteria bacterium]|nr:AbrB/MazE/SpoVT family DNA-binding domain-containing protein [Candidatus Saccharibacteria bacterium]